MSKGPGVMERVLESLPEGMILDTATGAGSFAGAIDHFRSSSGIIVATDAYLKPLESVKKMNSRNIIPAAMDAALLAFRENTFKAATIANSLHHMGDPTAVLLEMKRVLKPGGILLIQEMISDEDQTPPQQTHSIMHNWWGAVDSSMGIVHNPVYTRNQLERIFLSSGMKNIRFETFDVPCEDPFNDEIAKHIKGAWESYMEKASGNCELELQGHKALDHFEKHGFAGARTLMAWGSKT